METAAQRLPGSPAGVVALPERLGAGFVFAIGAQLWRSVTWLSNPSPLYAANVPIAQICVGLDRLYVRYAPGGSLAALDPRTGQPLDLGPLPSSPHLGRVAALDGWRALAIADLRGATLTTDAGASWRSVTFPIAVEPLDAVALDGGFGVAVVDGSRRTQWWRVAPDGGSEWLGESAREGPTPARAQPGAASVVQVDVAPHGTWGELPIVAAVEDGWPMSDGTAVVARDGALARVRLSDGALVGSPDAHAFPLAPARCHPLSLATSVRPGGFGFVCGEARGKTAVYEWDPSAERLVVLGQFDDPREVTASGRGSIVVRGGCGPRAVYGSWCVRWPQRAWKAVHVRGAGADRVHLVGMSDGRLLAVGTRAGALGPALWVNGRERGGDLDLDAASLPSRWPAVPPDVERVIRLGTWMSGFEERRPGVLGGWIDAGGTVVGVEIELAGGVRVGETIRDAGAVIAAGRWALGWTASRRGFESTDGGMTWAKGISLPDPIAEPSTGRERACGPVGCLLAGWTRVGWGTIEDTKDERASGTLRLAATRTAPPELALQCAPSDGALPTPGAHAHNAAGGARAVSTLAPESTAWGTASEFPAFSGRAGPALTSDELGVTAEPIGALEHGVGALPAARIYAWGPRNGNWDPLGRWEVRWDWLWAGWREARASASAPAPWSTLDGARRALGVGPMPALAWSLIPGDDAEHALLVSRHAASLPTAELFVLEAGRPPVAVQNDAGESFPELEAAGRLGGRWILATAQRAGAPPAAVLWSLDGSVAREVARVPRAGFESRPEIRLARRGDAHTLGVVFEGQPDASKPPSLWIASVDLETGAVADPESFDVWRLLARAAAQSRGPLCAAGEPGWEVAIAYPGPIGVAIGAWNTALQTAVARLRITADRACIERLLGSVEAYSTKAPEALATGARSPSQVPARAASRLSIGLSVYSSRARFAMQCALGPPAASR